MDDSRLPATNRTNSWHILKGSFIMLIHPANLKTKNQSKAKYNFILRGIFVTTYEKMKSLCKCTITFGTRNLIQ